MQNWSEDRDIGGLAYKYNVGVMQASQHDVTSVTSTVISGMNVLTTLVAQLVRHVSMRQAISRSLIFFYYP